MSAAADDPIVIVQIPVQAAYSNSPQSLKQLDKTLAAVPIRGIAKPASVTPQTVIVDSVKFGPNKNPSAALAYWKIENTVRGLNPATFESEKPATLQIPDLPRWAYTDWNRQKALNYVPSVAAWSDKQATVSDGRIFVNGEPKTVPSVNAAQTSIREVRLTLSSAIAYFKRLETLGISTSAHLYSRPLDINLAAGECNGGSQPLSILTPEQRQHISKALQSAPANKQVIVAIADTGYPTSDDYRTSRTFAFDAISASMKAYGLGPLPGDASDSAPPFACPTNHHVVEIAEALHEFESIDSAHVKVVYLPLTKEQGSEPLLRALLRLNYLFTLTRNAVGKPIGPAIITTPEQQSHADDENKLILDELPIVWPAFQKQLRTDKSILDAWLLLLELYAENADSVFFLSTSWTLNHEQPTVDIPDPLRGAVVAAAGNENEDIGGNPPGIDFAQRSVTAKDTVAVMNFTNGGNPDCNSGLINSNYQKVAFAIGYSGRLFGVDCSGSATSYATPRVAWLLAAAETVRRAKFKFFGADEIAYLDSIRSATGLQRFLLDPVVLIERMP